MPPVEAIRWKKAKTILGVLAAIVLSAIGSALWEGALKPATQWAGKAILTTVTFGSSAMSDAIYRDAAKGAHEEAALTMLTLVPPVVFASGLVIILSAVSFFFREKNDDYEDTSAASNPEEALELLKKQGDRSKERIQSIRLIGRKVTYALILAFLFFICTLFIQFLETSQAISTYVYFAQSLTICRPYISDDQAKILGSRFAAMRGREDYLRLVSELKVIANTNHLKLPDFTPW